MIDSMVLTCLSRNNVVSGGDPFLFSSVQSRILRLSGTCLSTPWSDGAASSVVRVLKISALKCLHNGDETMVLSAMEALRVCDLFASPRAPPLLFVHRTINENAERYDNLAPKAIADIQSYQADSRKARVAIEDAENRKQHEKRLREQEKEEYTLRKRTAREATDKSSISVNAALEPNTTRFWTEPETSLVDVAGSKEGEDESREMEVVEENQEDHTHDMAPSGGEDFLDIDIMADDGPDSDDD